VLLAVAVHGRNNTAVYTTPPSGWTVQDPSTDSTGPGVVRWYTKKIGAASSEPSTYTWAGGTGGRHEAVMVQVTGAPSTSQVDVKGAVATLISSPDRVIVPSVTTTSDLDLLLLACNSSTSGGVLAPFVAGTGTTVVASAGTNTGTAESVLTVLFQKAVALGSTGTRSTPTNAAAVASTGSGYMIAIKSAG
jgi:hypothetical protein